MKKMLTAILIALIVLPVMARSDSYFYAAVSGLYNHEKFTDVGVHIYDPTTDTWATQPTEDLSDNIYGTSIAIGYGISNFRGEIEMGLRAKANVSDAQIKSDSLTFNVYYDFNNRYRLTPFLGIGAGASQVTLHIDNLELSDTKINFAAMGAVGLTFRVTSTIFLNASYRYFYLGHVGLWDSLDVGGAQPAILNVRARDTSNEFMLGVIYRF